MAVLGMRNTPQEVRFARCPFERHNQNWRVSDRTNGYNQFGFGTQLG